MNEKRTEEDGIIFIKLKINDEAQLTPELKDQLQSAIKNVEIPFRETLEFTDIAIHGKIIKRCFHVEPPIRRKKAKAIRKRSTTDKIGIKYMDVPICSRCHFNDQVSKNTVEEYSASQHHNVPEWFCHRCKLPFN